MKFEIKNEKIRKILEDEIKEGKIEKKKKSIENTTIKNDLEKVALDVEFIENFDKYYDLDNRMSKEINSRPKKFLPGFLIHHDWEDDWEKVIKLRQALRVCLY